MKTDLLLSAPAFQHNDQLFFESLREANEHHFEQNDYFRYIWNKKKLNPNKLWTMDSLDKLPVVMVNIFKHHKLISCPEKDIILTLGSSGTSGQRSQIFLDTTSLERVKKLAYNVHEGLGMTSSKKYNYLCFTYDPAVAGDVGTAFTDELLTSFTDKAEVYYTFQYKDGDFKYDEEQTAKTLESFAQSEYPTRILGFPAFLYELVKNKNLKLELGPDSWVQTGGGWKTQENKKIPKSEFRRFVSQSLGLPEENIRDLFGMVEHGVPYVDDYQGRLRIPNYARVLIRNPKDLSLCSEGEIGLIQFVSTYLTSFPSTSLLTTDWGRVGTDERGSYLEIVGRAGISKNKGCALKALELMS